jgi:hypothetical protein
MTEHGDCGGWAFDPDNGSVFGMVVASSALDNLTYCTPIAKIWKKFRYSAMVHINARHH